MTLKRYTGGETTDVVKCERCGRELEATDPAVNDVIRVTVNPKQENPMDTESTLAQRVAEAKAMKHERQARREHTEVHAREVADDKARVRAEKIGAGLLGKCPVCGKEVATGSGHRDRSRIPGSPTSSSSGANRPASRCRSIRIYFATGGRMR